MTSETCDICLKVTWDASDEAAPRADERRVAELVERLRSALAEG